MVFKFLLAALGALCGGFAVMLVSVALQSYVLLLAGMAGTGVGVILLVQGNQANATVASPLNKSEEPERTTPTG